MHNAGGRDGYATHGQDHNNGQRRTTSPSRTIPNHTVPRDTSRPAPSRASQSSERNNIRTGDIGLGAGHVSQSVEGDKPQGRQTNPSASPPGKPGSSRGPSKNRRGHSSAPITNTTRHTSQAESWEHSQLLPFTPVQNYDSDTRYQGHIASSQRAADQIYETYKFKLEREHQIRSKKSMRDELHNSVFLRGSPPHWFNPANGTPIQQYTQLAKNITQLERPSYHLATYSVFVEPGEEMSPMRELVQTMVAKKIGCLQGRPAPWQLEFLKKINEHPFNLHGDSTKEDIARYKSLGKVQEP